MRQKFKSVGLTFLDTVNFMHTGQDATQSSCSQHHSIYYLWNFPCLRFIKAHTHFDRWNAGEDLFIIWQKRLWPTLPAEFLAEFPPTGKNEQSFPPWAKFPAAFNKFCLCSSPWQYLRDSFLYCRLLFTNSKNVLSKITEQHSLCVIIISGSLPFFIDKRVFSTVL